MRRRPLFVAVALGVSALVGVPLSTAAKAPAKNVCGKAKVARQVAGKRVCAPAKAKRIRPAVLTGPAAALDRGLRGPVLLRRRDRKAFAPLVPGPLRSALVGEVGRVEGNFETALASLGQRSEKSRARVGTEVVASQGGVTISRNVGAPVRVGERGVSVRSEVTTTISAETLVTLGLDEGRGVAGGDVSASQGIEVSTADGSAETQLMTFAVKSGDMTGRVGIGGTSRVRKIPRCPGSDGKIVVERDSDFLLRGKSVTLVGGKVPKKGAYASTETSQWRATAQMSADAKLQPFDFTVKVRYDESFSESALMFQGISRFSGTATMTGTLDPASGAMTESSVTLTPKFTSSAALSPTKAAEVTAAVAARIEASLRSEPPALLATMREVEARARDGRCTSISLSPASGSQLAPGARVPVAAKLVSFSDGEVSVVKWTATAAKGTVAPGTSPVKQPTFTVTAAKIGPETARVTVRAVSPAGISEATWTSRGAAELPAAYEGTFNQLDVYDGGRREEHTGTFRWVRSDEPGRYELAGGGGTLTTSGTVTGPCVISGAKTATFGPVARAASLLTVADYSDPSAPVGFAPGGGSQFAFTPPNPTRPVYFALTAVFPDGVGTESFACPSGTGGGTQIVSELTLFDIGTPIPALAPAKAFSVASTTALDGTFTARAGVVVRTQTWQLRAVPG